LDIETLYEDFGDTHVIMMRMHHLISSVLRIDKRWANFAFDFSEARYDIQELMLVTDILITDYSSVMFDYSNLKRPIIFYVYDYDLYSAEIRGTYFDLKKEAPGPVLETMDELVDAIASIDDLVPKYRDKQQAFNRKFCSLEKGTASRAVVDQVIRPKTRT